MQEKRERVGHNMEMKFKRIDEANNFEEDIKIGEDCEAKVVKEFRPIFTPILSRIYYSQNPILQRKGIDGVIQSQEVPYDIKCRRFRKIEYVGKDILLETVSVIEYNKPGWVYYTKSPVVLYFWLNRDATGFLDGYILYMDEVRRFFIGNEEKYYKPHNATSYHNGQIWHTENRIVKIDKFTISSIQHISKDVFTPKEQTSLARFFVW